MTILPEKLELLLSVPTTRAFVPSMTVPLPDRLPSAAPLTDVPGIVAVVPDISNVPLLVSAIVGPRLPLPESASVPPEIVVGPV